MDPRIFRELIDSAPTRRPKQGKADWKKIYMKAKKSGKVFTTKQFHKEIVKEVVNIGRVKQWLHGLADAKEPKVARVYVTVAGRKTYVWSFDDEHIELFKQRRKK